MDRQLARQVIEALRSGIPPQRGVSLYSVGDERLIEGIRTHHLSHIKENGIIRFVSGSWGSGKTHFFRLLREVAFTENCLVSNVQLNKDDAAFNKFERIFYSILRFISAPSNSENTSEVEIAPFGRVLKETLIYLSKGSYISSDSITTFECDRAIQKLNADEGIDSDFKRMIAHYWKTFLPEFYDSSIRDQRRQEILQWFSGEGTISTYKAIFSVTKIPSKDNARIMLQSLSAFVSFSGYRGLVVLFDEAEMTYSAMRRSALQDAFGNLRILIDTVDKLKGIFLVFATTPDFYTDPRHGIVIYGALAGRIGKPQQNPPRSIDKIWNFDEVSTNLATYQAVANKIRDIYIIVELDAATRLPSVTDINSFVAQLFSEHSSVSGVRFWRVLVAAVIGYFDDHADDETDGGVRSVRRVYRDIMERLSEE